TDHDRRHDRPGHRIGPGARRLAGVPQPLLRGAAALRLHADAQPRRRSLRAALPGALLMAATPRSQAITAAESVRRSLEGGGRTDWRSVAFQAVLVLLLVLTLGILAWLLAVVFVNGTPVLLERGTDFLTSPLASQPERAGVGQAI